MLLWLIPAQAARAEEGFGPLTAADQDRIDRGEIVVQVEKTSDALKSFRAVGQVKAPAERYMVLGGLEALAALIDQQGL